MNDEREAAESGMLNEAGRCRLCPRMCGADRNMTPGICGCDSSIMVAKTMLHRWEEPCISGSRGSGAVFLCGCPLGCVFCQNRDISRPRDGLFPPNSRAVTPYELAQTCLRLEARGAHNINFVSPTQYTPMLIEAVRLARQGGLSVPIVWNTGGYERRETISSLRGTADIFLTDMKYLSPSLSELLSGAADYSRFAMDALREMTALAGPPRYDGNGLMMSGVIVRHLVLPGCRRDSIEILHALAEEFGTHSLVLSLMSQYTPDFFRGCGDERLDKAMRRRITTLEYNSVAKEAARLDFDGYFQERGSAAAQYTPDWSLDE